ncbi:MAG: fasciclin domain-containing protein [Sulfitobacter sp.]
MNIVEIASGSEDFNLLVRALSAANLVTTVQDADGITVFAPTDAAFTALAQSLGFDGDASDEGAVFDAIVGALTDLGNGDPIPLLTDILLYHVSVGVQTQAEIEASTSIETLLADATIMPADGALGDGEPDLSDPRIATPDIMADNGIIQAIDAVLLPIDVPGNTPPPNIVEIASNSDDFNLLVKALVAGDLVTTVQEAEDITVFAPTDAAFTALAQNLGFEGDATDEDAVFDAIVAALTDLGGGDPIPLLTNILLYHVSGGAKTQEEIEAADSITTLLADASITPADGALVDGEPDLADPQIATPDIAASNGIIQAIDAVLLPIDVPGNSPSITGIVAASGDGFDNDSSDFDILLAAVQAAGLADALDAAAADLTVFAPTDGAFIATAQALGFSGDDEEGAFAFMVSALTLLSAGSDPIPLLTTILTYHVSPGTKDADAVLAADTLPTLAGIDLGVDGASLVDGDPDLPNPNIIATNINASNGIVHALDGVLIPIDILPTNGADDVDFIIADDMDNMIDVGDDNDFVSAGGGDDDVTGGAGNDVIVGGAGVDTAKFAGDLNDYAIQIAGQTVTVQDTGPAGTGTDTLNTVEFLEFRDGSSFVADGKIDLGVLQGAANVSGAQLETLTELYVAYFDRAPDAFGLLFWANALDEGVSLREVAELFFQQPETQAKLPDTLTAAEFVDLAYSHVLERTADAEGRAFWIEALESEGVSRAEFMLELIAGARANDAAAADVRTIEDKADIGVSYALINGLTNATNADSAMDAYERDNAAETLQTAQDLINGFASAATGGQEVTVQLVGIVDDPFAVA